jgi:hypothetical protein
LAIGTTEVPEQSTLLENSYALDMFAVVSSIFISSAHVEIWYGLANDPVPPANAETFCTGLAKIPIETATSTSTDHNLKDFNMYKFYMLKKNPLAKKCQGKLG